MLNQTRVVLRLPRPFHSTLIVEVTPSVRSRALRYTHSQGYHLAQHRCGRSSLELCSEWPWFLSKSNGSRALTLSALAGGVLSLLLGLALALGLGPSLDQPLWAENMMGSLPRLCPLRWSGGRRVSCGQHSSPEQGRRVGWSHLLQEGVTALGRTLWQSPLQKREFER